MAAYYPQGSGVFTCGDCSRTSLREDWVVDDFGTYFWYERCPCCGTLRLCTAVYEARRPLDEPERYLRDAFVPLAPDEDRVGRVVLFRPRDAGRSA